MGRIFRVILLGLTALWFGVIVPGHQRGVIALPGTESMRAGAGGQDCCTFNDGETDTSRESHAPRRDPGRHCAICFVAGLLQNPSAPVIAVVTAAAIERRDWPTPVTPEVACAVLPIHGRAPPLFHV